ncbi:MAG: SufD family Fe-S cluster assembly protein [Treponema sp.]|nr:SufD family Fe-S cluster assembly protein [Treponema sp.]
MEEKIDINPIPYLTWSWLKINKDTVSYNFSLSENYGREIQLPQGLNISSGKSINTELPEPEYAIGKEAAKLITESSKEGKIYTFTKSDSEDKALIIRINMDSNSSSHQIIHLMPGVKAKVIFLYEGGYDTQETLAGQLTKVYAEDDSQLQITKVQLCGKAVNQIDETAVVCGERAQVSLIQIELGGKHIDAGFHVSLCGYQSSFYSDTAYIAKNNQYIDMNQVVVHKGKKTTCDMKTDGTVKDNSTKAYRGTIDLITGSSGSVGNEMETTLLLSPTAIVKSAPIILCGEDDIKAEHGSTLGKLSAEMLFYMQSRGIDQATAEELLTRAKITAAAANIPDESIQNEINTYLDKN